jgi:ABC-type antimicrobial peptide transport system permease subunit
MKTFDLLKLGAKALLDRKVRSALTVLGIMIGSAIILALVASTSGLSAGVQANIAKIGANTLIVRAGGANFVSGSTSSYQLSPLDLPILSRIPDVLSVTPVESKSVSISVGGQTLSGQLFGVDLKLLPGVFKGITLAEGSYPQEGDTTSAVIGNGVAFPVVAGGSQLVGVNQAVSMTIGASKTSLSFLVKGIIAPYGSALFANVDNDIFVSLQAAQILLKTPYYSSIYIAVDSTDNVATVQSAIQSIYGTQVNLINAGSIASSISAVTSQLTVFLGSIGSVVLFVAAIGITNTMYVAVMERTREIGILKALGFKGAQIMSMFLTEAAITGIVGGILGTGLGFILAYAMGGSLSFGGGRGGGFGGGGGPGASTAPSPPIFSIQLIIFSLMFPIVMSVLAGLYPAWRASKMNIVNALKYE